LCNKTFRLLKVSTLGSDEDGENAGAISRSMMARSFGWRMMAYKIQNTVRLEFAWVLIIEIVNFCYKSVLSNAYAVQKLKFAAARFH
jgi:hypothetical protein